MSFEPPDGILDIGNATLRVGKLEVAETSGLNQGLLNIVKNNLLITENTEYASSNTWGIKLPTTWVADFDVKGHSEKYVEFNFYNEDKTSNTSGYTLNFKDTSLTLKYDNGTTLASATIPTIVDTYRKVNIFFERNVIAVSIDGTRVLYDKRPSVLSRVISTTGSAFVNVFIEQNASNSKFKNLRIVNGRFISDQTSNIAFIGGNLGVGVNSPKESLDILGNMHLTRVSNVSQISVDSNVVIEYTGPHDRPLRKYPEVAFLGDGDLTQFGYIVSSSGQFGVTYPASNAFTGTATTTQNAWVSPMSTFETTQTNNGSIANSSRSFTGAPSGEQNGPWLKIELPNAIKLSHSKIYRWHASGYDTRLKDGYIYGSNDDSTYTRLVRLNNLGTSWDQYTGVRINVNATEHYKYYVLHAREIYQTDNTSAANSPYVTLGEWELYGYEEGSGSLDTTLKSVYNVPATTGTQLEVYYDAKDLADGAVTSVSGLGGTTIGGTAYGDPQISDRAFVFDGTGDAIQTAATSFTGNAIFTASLWVKLDRVTDSTSQNVIFTIGYDGTQTQSGLRVEEGTGKFRFYTYSGTGSLNTEVTAVTNTWYHLNLVHNGSSGYKLYINGEMVGETFTDDLNLASNSTVGLGAAFASSGTINSGTLPFKGSIANFRLYSKALNADQIKELYDYQKDYFLGSKSQVTLYKGHLGVGVTEPSGQLELAGDERIQEYPPRGFGVFADDPDYSTYIEGHGVFTAYGSSQNNTGKSYSVIGAFDKTVSPDNSCWLSATNTYSGGLPTSSAAKINGVSGEWCALQCPYPIKLKSFITRVRSASSGENNRMAKSGIIWGSNDGATWYQVHSWGGRVYSDTNNNNFEVNSTEYYSHHALQTTETQGNVDATVIGEWRLFGTPGPTTLDKGSLTLGRSLDVPRISRYDVDTETPRPEKLVLDLDTTVNRFPIDISGNFNDGVFQGNASYSAADKAFNFDGTDDEILVSSISGATDNYVHSVSTWVKFRNLSSNPCIFMLGNDNSNNQPSALRNDGTSAFKWFFYNNDVEYTTYKTLSDNIWYHIACSYTGGNTLSDKRLWLDGIELVGTPAGDNFGDPLDLTANAPLRIGQRQNNNNDLNGQISNFKLYNAALEPSEVKKLYNLGRTGRSMVISDTAVGIGKAPEAQLDVRGVTRFDGRVGIGTNVPNFALHIHGNNKGVQAIASSQWINWLTNPNYNTTYNGNSPSYPVTTHASMTTTMVYSRHSIGCSGYFWSHGSTLNMSDRRVKTNIVDVNDDTCLRTLRQLKPKHYNYINIRERGSDPVWGFIAQEVKEAIPYSTVLKTDYIPNIDEKARLLDDGRTIVFTNFNTASLESNATTIRIMNKNQDEFDITLTEVLDPNTIRVNEDITEHTFVYDQEDDNGNVLEGNYVYVYGQKIDDFVYLKKDAIWTVTTAALQEVDRQLQYERARNDALEARVTVLEQAKYM
jgi:hypothetical protein